MKLFQSPTNLLNKTSSIMSVNSDIFAEIVSLFNEEAYNFRFTFRLFLTNPQKKIEDYDRVKITVKRKEPNVASSITNSSNIVSNKTFKQLNNTFASSVRSSIAPNNGLLKPKLPARVENKLYSGLKMIKDLEVKEDFIDQSEVFIAGYVTEVYGNEYTYTELIADQYKKDKPSYSTSSDSPYDTSRVDPTNTLVRINSEFIDITQSISDPEFLKLSSNHNLDESTYRNYAVGLGKSPLYYDIVKYYLRDVPKSPLEDSYAVYNQRQTTKQLDHVDISQTIPIKKTNKNLNLTVRFDLYRKGTNVVEETITENLYMPSHVEAFEALHTPPEISVIKSISSFQVLKNNSLSKGYDLTIIDKNYGKNEVVDSYNIYLKSIGSLGDVGPYKKLGTVKNRGITHFNFNIQSNLSVLRVVPVDSQNRESNIFSNVIVGPGHSAVGNLMILPNHFGKNETRVDVFNIPNNVSSLTLFRRDCTDNPDSHYKAFDKMKVKRGTAKATFIDSATDVGRTYEYYVVALINPVNSSDPAEVVSNYVMFKNVPNYFVEKSISVLVSEAQSLQAASGEPSFSFKIETKVSKSENERITKTLKDQIGELYEQYLSPIANASSPLGDDSKGVPQYNDLFFHEVVRYDLNTGERETFELVSDGVFEDKKETQKVYNIKPLNPTHEYQYHIFTFKKNPIELFKKFVARGIDNKGKEWFYLPYKWRNPSARRGVLYADDVNGIPIIDAYDNFTSESFGLTASYRLDGSGKYTSLTQIVADRIDRNTVKVSWSFSGTSTYNNESLYDSFIVMKVVNGVRRIVGRTFKNYIYHELDEEDTGTVYYIVVPVMSEFDIDDPGYSNTLLIQPDGLTQLVKTTNRSVFKLNDITKITQSSLVGPKLNNKISVDAVVNQLSQKNFRTR